jgi:hypothetical protein
MTVTYNADVSDILRFVDFHRSPGFRGNRIIVEIIPG